MADLLLLRHSAWSTPGVPPIIQWGHAPAGESPSLLVRLRGGDQARVPAAQVQRRRLVAGIPVLYRDARARGVVLGADAGTAKYSVFTPYGPIRGCPQEALWPDPDPWPLRGALSAPSACAALEVYSQEPTRARLRLSSERYRVATLADGLSGASWIDAELVPHQVAAVQRVLTSPSVGHLLADEVGLGKTIEALLIWSALQAESPTMRTLVVSPRSLVPQWAFEIQRRSTRGLGKWYQGLPRIFVAREDEPCQAFDAPEPSRPVVAEFAALEGNVIPPEAVDLLIVDEAHALTKPQQAGVERLAAQAQHTLLLTATPRRTRRLTGAAARRAASDAASFTWAVSVVDPRFAGDPRAVEEATAAAGALSSAAVAALAGDADAAAELTSRIEERRGALGAVHVPLTVPPAGLVRAAATEIGPYDRVVRTQRRWVRSGLGCRDLREWPIHYRREELAVLRALAEWFAEAVETGEEGAAGAKRRAASSWAALRDDAPPPLQALLKGLGDADAREDALLDLLGTIWAEDPSRRIVIRAEYAQSRRRLKARLEDLLRDGALRATSALEDARWDESEIGPVALVERGQKSLVDSLADLTGGADAQGEAGAAETILGNLIAFTEGDACVLIGDSTAETGLNLQHASDLIFFDLPWLPRAAEQWIGRLDRLGRRRGEEVRVHVLTHPAATDSPLIGLYKVLGVFGRGYQVPPEIAHEVDSLISKADGLLLDWREAIERARQLVEHQVEEGDALLESQAPDQGSAERLIEARAGTNAAAHEYFNALASSGFHVEARGDERVAVSWISPTLGLRELREQMAPAQARYPGQLAGSGRTIDVPLAARRLGAGLTRGSTMLFSPRHPLFVDVVDELALEAGGNLVFLTAPRPAGWGLKVGPWMALVQARTFPEAQGEAALWRADPRDGRVPSLSRLRTGVSRAIGRICCAAAPPRLERLAYNVHITGAAVHLEAVHLDGGDGPFERLLPTASKRNSEQWRAAALRAVEADLARAAAERAAADVREALDDVRRYVAYRKAAISAAAEKAVLDKERLVQSTDRRNPGFVKMLEDAQVQRQTIAEFLNDLATALDDHAAIGRGAVTPVITQVVFVELKEGP